MRTSPLRDALLEKRSIRARTCHWRLLKDGVKAPGAGADTPGRRTDSGHERPHEQRTRFMPKPVIAGLAVVMVAIVALGGFFGGQNTRASGTEVSSRIDRAVKSAVTRTTAAQKQIRRKALHEARADQKRHDMAVMRRLRLKLTQAAERKSAASYASGHSVGYSTGNADGYSSGVDEGLVEGSDELTCSDDPDVTWLPGCW